MICLFEHPVRTWVKFGLRSGWLCVVNLLTLKTRSQRLLETGVHWPWAAKLKNPSGQGNNRFAISPHPRRGSLPTSVVVPRIGRASLLFRLCSSSLAREVVWRLLVTSCAQPGRVTCFACFQLAGCLGSLLLRRAGFPVFIRSVAMTLSGLDCGL
ncbi:hypothetical protein BDV11DRAFT_57057 [Aspergillus similis]